MAEWFSHPESHSTLWVAVDDLPVLMSLFIYGALVRAGLAPYVPPIYLLTEEAQLITLRNLTGLGCITTLDDPERLVLTPKGEKLVKISTRWVRDLTFVRSWRFTNRHRLLAKDPDVFQ